LTTLFENTAAIAIPAPRKKLTLLPLLVVLFVISYGLMTMLIVEQGETIQVQSNLIKILLPDSKELWSLRSKAIGEKIRTEAPSTQEQAPTVHTPSTQTPSSQTPSTQVAPQHKSPSRGGKTAKPQTQLPSSPASDLLDQRRVLVTI
jgi:hypothetical protein